MSALPGNRIAPTEEDRAILGRCFKRLARDYERGGGDQNATAFLPIVGRFIADFMHYGPQP